MTIHAILFVLTKSLIHFYCGYLLSFKSLQWMESSITALSHLIGL